MKPAPLRPLRIEPTFSPRIWGARSLAPLYPEKTDLAEPLGEAWLTGVDCCIASEPFEGKTLGAAWREMPVEWRGTQLASLADFPILVKFIFPKDKLSIQVHPDDAYAEKHERAAGGRGKTEMWHAVSAEPKARVLIGLKPGSNKEEFFAALNSGTLESLFVPHEVHAADTFFLPARTPHTIGPGMILCEVQEYSDLTYRVYDYGRVDATGNPRELHIEKALEVMNFGPTTGGTTSRLSLPAQGVDRSLLAACRYFAAERLEPAISFATKTDPRHFDLFVILSGSGTLDAPGFSISYSRGECWYLPASLGSYHLVPNGNLDERTTLIRAYVPDLAALREELKLAKHSDTVIRYAVFD